MGVDRAYLRTIEHWRARFESVGVPRSSIDRVVSELDEWSDWPAVWRRLANQEAAYAERQEAAGHEITAADCWFRAGLYYHYGQFILFDDEVERAQLVEAKLEAFARAMPGMRPPGQKIAIDTPAGTLHAIVRHPGGPEPTPAVIVLPGADSSKEEYASFENLLLERGLATIGVDGPGQGETRHRGSRWIFRYEEAFPAVVDSIRSSPQFLFDSIGLMGVSFGGYLAPRVGAHCPDIKAVVSLGGCFDLSGWDQLPPLLKEDLAYLFGTSDADEARALAFENISLKDVLPRLRSRLLIVHSTDDRIFSDQAARRMKELKDDAELVIYEGGDHCCHNRSHHAKPLIADWLVDALRG